MSDQPPPGFSPPNQPSGFAPPPGVGQPPPGAPSFRPPPASAGGPGGFGPGVPGGPGGPGMVPVQPPPERGPRSKAPLVLAAGVVAVVAIVVGVVLAATSGDDGKQTGDTTENTAITPRTGRVTTIADTRPITPVTDATGETGPRFSIPPLTDPQGSQTTTARTAGSPTTTRAPATTAAPANALQPVGATITSAADHLAVTVLDVVDNAPPGEFSEPDPGNKFVAVRIHVANTKAEPANTFASVSAKLIDSAGQQFGQAFVDANVGPTFFVLTVPGNDVRAGWLTFEIPEGSTPQRFQWELDGDTAEWDLVAARQEPAGLGQPTSAKLPIGGTATVTGNDDIPFELTVNQVVDNAEPDFGQAADGMRFIAVQVTYHNVGNAAISEFAEGELEIVDPDGQQWGTSYIGTNAGPGFDGEIKLAAGDSRTGFVSFEIPQGMTPLKLAGYVGADGDVASFALA